MARKVLALAFRNAIASPGANPGRAVACASGLDEDRLIDIRNDEGAGSSCECNSAIGCYMSTKNSNCVECCTPNGAYKAPAPDSSVAAPKKGGVGYLVAKRVFDIAFSAGVCLVLAVPVAVACAAICVDTPGKPFFRQERIGQGGKKIYIFKLRTMVSDAHDHPERYMSSAQLETWRREQKLDDDPRITRVGRILRRTSLDELPQFLNVLSGDLSVIGPRPVTLQETYEYGDAREEVLSCKPGITGWWAVTDRNNSTWQSGQRQARELWAISFLSESSQGTIRAIYFEGKTVKQHSEEEYVTVYAIYKRLARSYPVIKEIVLEELEGLDDETRAELEAMFGIGGRDEK